MIVFVIDCWKYDFISDCWVISLFIDLILGDELHFECTGLVFVLVSTGSSCCFWKERMFSAYL